MTLPELEDKRAQMHQYLMMKLVEYDYHAVADAAMDLRELQTKINIMRSNPFEMNTCHFDKFNEAVK